MDTNLQHTMGFLRKTLKSYSIMCTMEILKERETKSNSKAQFSNQIQSTFKKGDKKGCWRPNQINSLIKIQVFVVYTGEQKDLLKACNGSNLITILTTFNTLMCLIIYFFDFSNLFIGFCFFVFYQPWGYDTWCWRYQGNLWTMKSCRPMWQLTLCNVPRSEASSNSSSGKWRT